MATHIIWPASLPQDVLLEGYNEAPTMPKYSVPTDNSMPIERPKTSLRATKIQCAMDMTDDQLTTFEDFVFYDLGQAVRPFYKLHPRLGRQVKCQLPGDDPYQISKMSPTKWKVTWTMTVFP